MSIRSGWSYNICLLVPQAATDGEIKPVGCATPNADHPSVELSEDDEGRTSPGGTRLNSRNVLESVNIPSNAGLKTKENILRGEADVRGEPIEDMSSSETWARYLPKTTITLGICPLHTACMLLSMSFWTITVIRKACNTAKRWYI
jgi:hypothetical protein